MSSFLGGPQRMLPMVKMESTTLSHGIVFIYFIRVHIITQPIGLRSLF